MCVSHNRGISRRFVHRSSEWAEAWVIHGDNCFCPWGSTALTAQFGPGCRETWTDANRSRGQKQHPGFGRPRNGRTALPRSGRAIQRARLNRRDSKSRMSIVPFPSFSRIETAGLVNSMLADFASSTAETLHIFIAIAPRDRQEFDNHTTNCHTG
jgi:hypothetical protein